MKTIKKITALLICLTLIASTTNAYAGSHRHSHPGRILSDALGITVLANCLNSSYRTTSYAPVYPGNISTQVWIPAKTYSIWVEPQYEWQWYDGRWQKILLRDGYYRYETTPGYYATKTVQPYIVNYSYNYYKPYRSYHHSYRDSYHHRGRHRR